LRTIFAHVLEKHPIITSYPINTAF